MVKILPFFKAKFRTQNKVQNIESSNNDQWQQFHPKFWNRQEIDLKLEKFMFFLSLHQQAMIAIAKKMHGDVFTKHFFLAFLCKCNFVKTSRGK